MRNCINLFSGFAINAKPLKLVRILMNKVPELAESSNSNNKYLFIN